MEKTLLRKLAKTAFPTWKGRKLYENTTGKVMFTDTNWGGGTRNYYVSLQLATGKARGLHVKAPWVNPVEGLTVPIPEGFVVAEHTIFCGKECGVTLYFPNTPMLSPTSLPAGA